MYLPENRKAAQAFHRQLFDELAAREAQGRATALERSEVAMTASAAYQRALLDIYLEVRSPEWRDEADRAIAVLSRMGQTAYAGPGFGPPGSWFK